MNDLIDPYVIGVLPGAFVALSLGVLLLGLLALTLKMSFILGFLGSLIVGTLVAVVSLKYGLRGTLIIGIGISLSLQGIASILAYLASAASNRPFLPMLLGTTEYVTWNVLIYVLIIGTISTLLIWILSWKISALEYGEDFTESFRINYKRVLGISIILSSASAGAAVGCCGIIPFLGLISANIAKRLSPLKPSGEILYSIIIASMVMTISDTLASVIVTPYGSLPVGAFLSFIGGLALVILILFEGGIV
ncbi:hypothetical protein IPA_04370 [Ignicoccus pacificus DSM 13166]|uniref:Uncharacterized protein n=1 Tax=Ignicoccus pacificus DSM 13166 TaxID=940294 RepID=A0A977KB77_9CREN|nr:hypothetical protein IPA_04370 [Ignicoccus pacificus DSM 13166]